MYIHGSSIMSSHRKGRVFALLLSLFILVVSVIPITVSAADSPVTPFQFDLEYSTPYGLWNIWGGSGSSTIGPYGLKIHVERCLQIQFTIPSYSQSGDRFIRYSTSYSSSLLYSQTSEVTGTRLTKTLTLDDYTGDVYFWFFAPSSASGMDVAPEINIVSLANPELYYYGFSDGFQQGTNQIIPVQYQSGYTAGYDAGLRTDSTILFDAVTGVVYSVPHAIRTMFNYDIFGINFFTLFSVGFFLLFAIKIAGIFI